MCGAVTARVAGHRCTARRATQSCAPRASWRTTWSTITSTRGSSRSVHGTHAALSPWAALTPQDAGLGSRSRFARRARVASPVSSYAPAMKCHVLTWAARSQARRRARAQVPRPAQRAPQGSTFVTVLGIQHEVSGRDSGAASAQVVCGEQDSRHLEKHFDDLVALVQARPSSARLRAV
eukprot:3251688-Rhodomonas_salina.2